MQPSPNSLHDQSTSATPATSSAPDAQAALKRIQTDQAFKAAASNFYSIALFSLINSVLDFVNLGFYFPIGLGITQVIDGFALGFGNEASQYKAIFYVVGIVLDVVIVAIVALFGRFIAGKRSFLIPLGGVLYLLDGLLLLAFREWIGAAFHAYFLYRIFVTWQATRRFTRGDDVFPDARDR